MSNSTVGTDFERCARCGDMKGAHKVPEVVTPLGAAKIKVLLCPSLLPEDGWIPEWVSESPVEEDDGPPKPSPDAVELERLRNGFLRLIQHYRGQAYRRGPGVGRTALLKVCDDMQEMLRRHRGSQG